ncbi:MAG: hypothetical protein PHY94_06755 [Candidatus Omnitrophica bacterium]|nr:hypothetical protein [Candidatus Omnitrophota bacterium]
MQKKQWKKPKLYILLRSDPAEGALASCKIWTEINNHMGPTSILMQCALDYYAITGICYTCSALGHS